MGDFRLKAFNVRVIGSGERVVVFAHGFGTDQSAWKRILPYFITTYRVVLYDLACAGSVNPDHFNFQRYNTLDGYVDDLIAILDALELHRYTFVGHSLSAMAGILASIRRPELFDKLILLGASPRFANDEDYHGGFDAAEVEKTFELMKNNYVSWVEGNVPLAVGADVPEALQEFSRTLFNMRPDISLFVCRMAFNCDLRGVLGLVSVPCHIIQTCNDLNVPTSVMVYLHHHLGPTATLDILKTEGHLPHLSAPALLGPAIARALR